MHRAFSGFWNFLRRRNTQKTHNPRSRRLYVEMLEDRNLLSGFAVTPTSLMTSETGTSDFFTVKLTTQPTGPVTVNLNTSVAGQGSLSQSSLTFDDVTWNIDQTVTVTGLDDHIVHGDQIYQVTGIASSIADPTYDTLPMPSVDVTNTEADVAGYLVTPTSLTTSETGTSASFTVVLTSQPTALVTVNLNTSVSGQGSLSVGALSFDSTDWFTPKTVTVTGLDDQQVHGDQSYQVTGLGSSPDANYNNLAMTPVDVTNTEADVVGINVSPTVLTTSETGTTATFTVTLKSKPFADVTLILTPSVTGQGTLSDTSLFFDASNWSTPHTVTVTGVDDHLIHGDQHYQITGSANSTDLAYDGLAMTPVDVTNTEADVAGFTVTPTSLITSEAGTSAPFTVKLTSQPTGTVTLNLTMSVAGQGSLSATSLTFDSSNWSVAQTVTVTGLDDHIVHGSQGYLINGTASSTDTDYDTLLMTPVNVSNTEADVAGFTVTPTTLTTAQSGTTGSFTVKLTSKPLNPVTLQLTPSVAGQGSLSQTSLSFDDTNWDVAQAVTVTGLDDHLPHGDVHYQISGTATSTDTHYNSLGMTPVNVTNTVAVGTGVVTGFVYLNTSTNPLAGALVSLTGNPTSGPPLPIHLNTTTDANGQFTFTGLPNGTYQISAGPFAGLMGSVTVGNVSASTGVNVVSPATPGSQTNIVVTGGLNPTAIWLGLFFNTTLNSAFPFGTPGSGVPNNLPFVTSNIGAQALSSTTTSKVIDLAGKFGDPLMTTSSVTMDVTANGVAHQKINLTLTDAATPQAVANFYDYINAGAYNNNFFFRNTNTAGDGLAALQAGGAVITDGVGPSANSVNFPTIPDEISALNQKGTLAMANTGAANTASRQFFFNTADNPTLDHTVGSGQQGYTVFAKVSDAASQAVLDGLAATPVQNLSSSTFATTTSGFLLNEVPLNSPAVTQFPTDASKYLVINSVTANQRDDYLTYSIVSNSNSTLVTAALTNEQLTLTKGTGTGTATIVVKATDRFGASVQQTFNVTVS